MSSSAAREEVSRTFMDNSHNAITSHRFTNLISNIRMSHPTNSIYLENANLNFEEALEGADWKTCEIIIADLKDKGFDKEAETMQKQLTHERFEDR